MSTKGFNLFQCCGTDNTNKLKQTALLTAPKKPQQYDNAQGRPISNSYQDRKKIFEQKYGHINNPIATAPLVQNYGMHAPKNNLIQTPLNRQTVAYHPAQFEVQNRNSHNYHIVNHNLANVEVPNIRQKVAPININENTQIMKPHNLVSSPINKAGFSHEISKNTVFIPNNQTQIINQISKIPAVPCQMNHTFGARPATPNKNVYMSTIHTFTPQHFYKQTQVMNSNQLFHNDRQLVEQLTIKRPLSVHGKQITKISAIIVPKINFFYTSPTEQTIKAVRKDQNPNQNPRAININVNQNNPQNIIKFQTPSKNNQNKNDGGKDKKQATTQIKNTTESKNLKQKQALLQQYKRLDQKINSDQKNNQTKISQSDIKKELESTQEKKIEKKEKQQIEEKQQKVEKIDKPQKPEKIEKIEKMDQIDKPEKQEKVEKTEKVEKLEKKQE